MKTKVLIVSFQGNELLVQSQDGHFFSLKSKRKPSAFLLGKTLEVYTEQLQSPEHSWNNGTNNFMSVLFLRDIRVLKQMEHELKEKIGSLETELLYAAYFPEINSEDLQAQLLKLEEKRTLVEQELDGYIMPLTLSA